MAAKKCIIHVNRAFIAANLKDGGSRPVYTVKQGRQITYAHGVRIHDATVELVDPRETPPLSCGARAWIEVVSGTVELIDPCSFSEAKTACAA